MLKINIQTPTELLGNKIHNKNQNKFEVKEEDKNKEGIIQEDKIIEKHKKSRKTPKRIMSKEAIFSPKEKQNINLENDKLKIRKSKSPIVKIKDNLIPSNQNHIKNQNLDLVIPQNNKKIHVKQFFPNQNLFNQKINDKNDIVSNNKLKKISNNRRPLTAEQQIRKIKNKKKLVGKKEDILKKQDIVKIESEKNLQKFEILITKPAIKHNREEKNERLKSIEEVKNLPKYSKNNPSIKYLKQYQIHEEKNVSDTINEADKIIRKVF